MKPKARGTSAKKTPAAKKPTSSKTASGNDTASAPEPTKVSGSSRKKSGAPKKAADGNQKAAGAKSRPSAKASASVPAARAKKKPAPAEAASSRPSGKEKPDTKAAAEPAQETSAENPLHRKLGLRPGISGLVIAPPLDEDNPLLPLPESFQVMNDAEALSASESRVEYLHFFARNRAELARMIVQLRDRLAPGGSLWVSWIKQSSSRRGEGLPGDLNENVIRRLALTSGLVDVKVAALDHEWSALRLVHRKH